VPAEQLALDPDAAVGLVNELTDRALVGEFERLVDRNLGRASCEGRDLLHERARCRHPEMCPQRVSVGPVLDKRQPQRIFTIAVNSVRQAPRFLPGAAHVGNAERKDVVNAFRPSLNAARDNKHR